MRKIAYSFAAVLTLVLASATGLYFYLAPTSAGTPIIAESTLRQTNSGEVVGFVDNGVSSWLGIPYAQPPVGDLAIVDRSQGLETLESMWKITQVTPLKKDLASGKHWRKTGTGTAEADRYFSRAFADPFPFSKEYSMVSFGGEDARWHHLYVLAHATGELAPLFRTEGSCFSPV